MTCSFTEVYDQIRFLQQFVVLDLSIDVHFQCTSCVYLKATTGGRLLEGGEVGIIWQDEVAGIHIPCAAKQLEADFGDNTKDGAGSS